MINKLLLAGDKFMPEMHLRTVLDGNSLKKRTNTQLTKETRGARDIYRNKILSA